MALQVRVTTNPGAAEALLTGLRQGLAEGGRIILAASDALAPTEPVPRHGIHMTETGYSTVIPGVDDDVLEVGYRAFWAPIENEDLTVNHPHGGGPKFLDRGMMSAAGLALQAAAEGVQRALGT